MGENTTLTVKEKIQYTLSEQLSIQPSEFVMKKALVGYQKLLKKGELTNNEIITIVDLSLPSTEKRLWIMDLVTGEVLYHTWVAHGKKSGELMAESFSNVAGSWASSPGFYVTGDMYIGKNGWSLYLDGKEPGINDNARSRAVVMHAAAYANPSFIQRHGRLGRSQGCPAIPEENAVEIMQKIAQRSCLYVHTDQHSYLSTSTFLKN